MSVIVRESPEYSREVFGSICWQFTYKSFNLCPRFHFRFFCNAQFFAHCGFSIFCFSLFFPFTIRFFFYSLTLPRGQENKFSIQYFRTQRIYFLSFRHRRFRRPQVVASSFIDFFMPKSYPSLKRLFMIQSKY